MCLSIRRVLLVIFALAAVITLVAMEMASPARSEVPPADPNHVLAIGAAEIGLTPEGIVVSGLSGSVSAIAQRLASAQNVCAQILDRRQALSVAQASVAALEAAIRNDPTNQSLRGQYDQANNQVQSTQASLTSARTQLFTTVLGDAAPQSLAMLQTFQQSAGRVAPPAFRIRPRTDTQWHAIEVAIVAERRAQRRGTALGEEHAALLTAVRAEPEVLAAQNALDQHLVSVRAELNQALQLG